MDAGRAVAVLSLLVALLASSSGVIWGPPQGEPGNNGPREITVDPATSPGEDPELQR